MLTTTNLVKKNLDEIEAYQHMYGGTDLQDMETWLNAASSGYTAEIVGWMGTLSVKKDNVEVVQINPGEFLVRSGPDKLLKVSPDLLLTLWEPAV